MYYLQRFRLLKVHHNLLFKIFLQIVLLCIGFFQLEICWTFIKLNTRNGQMWQVQWSTGDNIFQVPLSLTSRVSSEEEKNGRFFLYPTTNIYNFILLDQIDGRAWQVQWSTEEKNRGECRYIKFFNWQICQFCFYFLSLLHNF